MADRCSRAGMFVVVVLCSFSAAEADPLRVTSGKYQLNSSDTPVFIFEGNGFVLPGITQTIPAGIFPFEDCLVCNVGDPIRMGSNIQGELGQVAANRSALFDGVTYDPATQPLYYSGGLTFDADTVAAPAGPGDPLLFVDRPFTFSGSLMAFLTPDRSGAPVFATDLVGSGSVRFLLLPGEAGLLNFGDVTYSFAGTQPVPEPATLALFGSGLSALLLRGWKRRSRQV